MGRDTRTPCEVYHDMVADECTDEEIAEELDWTLGQVRNAYLKMCLKMGERPDEK